MKKMIIYDPAMCCSTGVCGPSIDPELLRVSTIISNLSKYGIKIERYNLTSSPQTFVDNTVINEILNKEGTAALPVTLLDGQVVKTKGYPTNEEFSKLLGVPERYFIASEKSKGCCCDGGCC